MQTDVNGNPTQKSLALKALAWKMANATKHQGAAIARGKAKLERWSPVK